MPSSDLLGLLAEVPDVAGVVLGEPIERVLGELAVHADLVVDLDALDPQERVGLARDRELVVLQAGGRLSFVDERRARLQREEPVRDAGAVTEVLRIDHRVVLAAAELIADVPARVELITALGPCVGERLRRSLGTEAFRVVVGVVVANGDRDPIVVQRAAPAAPSERAGEHDARARRERTEHVDGCPGRHRQLLSSERAQIDAPAVAISTGRRCVRQAHRCDIRTRRGDPATSVTWGR